MTRYKTTGEWSVPEGWKTIYVGVIFPLAFVTAVVLMTSFVLGRMDAYDASLKPVVVSKDCGAQDAKLSGPEVLSVNTTDPATSLKLSEKLSNPPR